MAHRLSRERILGDPHNCTSGHRAFTTEAAARASLAHVRTGRRGEVGSRIPGRVETQVYRCDVGGTAHWHLCSTSRRTDRGTHDTRGRRP